MIERLYYGKESGVRDMKIKITIHLDNLKKIDEVVKKAEEIKKMNPYAEINIEVHEAN